MSKSCNDREHIVHIVVLPTKEGLSIELKAKGCAYFVGSSLEAILEEFHKLNPVMALTAVEHFLDHALSDMEDDND